MQRKWLKEKKILNYLSELTWKRETRLWCVKFTTDKILVVAFKNWNKVWRSFQHSQTATNKTYQSERDSSVILLWWILSKNLDLKKISREESEYQPNRTKVFFYVTTWSSNLLIQMNMKQFLEGFLLDFAWLASDVLFSCFLVSLYSNNSETMTGTHFPHWIIRNTESWEIWWVVTTPNILYTSPELIRKVKSRNDLCLAILRIQNLFLTHIYLLHLLVSRYAHGQNREFETF